MFFWPFVSYSNCSFLCNLIMNMLIWNCRGAPNPFFCDVVNNLIQMHSPTIMVIGETKVSGVRAERISNRINLDRAIFANSIGLSGGLWVLWDS